MLTSPVRRSAALLAVLSATAFVGQLNAQEHEAPHWGYQGDTGPNQWGNILEEYAVCQTGGRQSPIDLPAGAPTTTAALTFDYRPSALNVVNNGHTVQVNYDPGSTLTIDGKVYEVAQFHFHTPSEHTVEGVAAPMEMHIVHRAEDGALAVVGVLFYIAEEPNEVLAGLFADLPAAHEEVSLGGTIDLAEAFDLAAPLISYGGSLTTPPCTEGVSWFVATHVETISTEQLGAFVSVVGLNARPVQALNDRPLGGP